MQPDPIDIRLQEIREREQKATKGPWWWWTNTMGIPDALHCGEPGGGQGYHILTADDYLFRFVDEDDQDFIAEARQDIPWLLYQLSASRQRERELREALEKVETFLGGVKRVVTVLRDNNSPIDGTAVIQDCELAMLEIQKALARTLPPAQQ